jgi:hypothetical protein
MSEFGLYMQGEWKETQIEKRREMRENERGRGVHVLSKILFSLFLHNHAVSR